MSLRPCTRFMPFSTGLFSLTRFTLFSSLSRDFLFSISRIRFPFSHFLIFNFTVSFVDLQLHLIFVISRLLWGLFFEAFRFVLHFGSFLLIFIFDFLSAIFSRSILHFHSIFSRFFIFNFTFSSSISIQIKDRLFAGVWLSSRLLCSSKLFRFVHYWSGVWLLRFFSFWVFRLFKLRSSFILCF